MFSESKVTEIYCMTDDFCKEFVLQQEINLIIDRQLAMFLFYIELASLI